MVNSRSEEIVTVSVLTRDGMSGIVMIIVVLVLIHWVSGAKIFLIRIPIGRVGLKVLRLGVDQSDQDRTNDEDSNHLPRGAIAMIEVILLKLSPGSL